MTKVEDFKGLKFRTVGISIDLFTGLGAAVNALPGAEIVPALDRGLLDGAEFNNASSDRLLGFADVSKVCMLQSYHQSAEQFEILFNKDKFKALPPKIQAQIETAVEAASADVWWKSVDRYSKDYIELQTKDKVKFYKTPDSILQKELDVFDEVMEKYAAKNPLFKEILEFAEGICQARGELVPGHRGQPAHGLQPLLRRQEGRSGQSRTGEEMRVFASYSEGLDIVCTIAPPHPNPLPRSWGRGQGEGGSAWSGGSMISQLTAIRAPSASGWLIFKGIGYAEIAAYRRQDQHLCREDFFLAHRVAYLPHHLRGVHPICAGCAACLGLRHHAPDVRDPVHDGGRLHPLEERDGPRRRPLRFLTAASAGLIRPDALHHLLPPRGDGALLGRVHLCRRVLGHLGEIGHHRRGPADLSTSRPSSPSPGCSYSCRASWKSYAASAA